MRDEGVIKFNCNWKKTGPVLVGLDEIMSVRQKLFRLGLIGVYPDGIGYGNLSILEPAKTSFIISGLQTGHFETVTAEHFARVTNATVETNRNECEGPQVIGIAYPRNDLRHIQRLLRRNSCSLQRSLEKNYAPCSDNGCGYSLRYTPNGQ